MGDNKILTFVSTFSNKAVELYKSNETEEYIGPAGEKISGIFTNEAPVRYLMNKTKIHEIVCINTEETQKEIQKGCGISPFEYLKKCDFSYRPRFVDIGYDKSNKDQVIADIVGKFSGSDTVYIDSTGGFRDTIFQLLEITKILRYKGIKVAQVVYSDFTNHEIRDVTELCTGMDLINGLHEFDTHCDVSQLKEYYKNHYNYPAINALLEEIERLSDHIQLCRVSEISGQLNKVNDAFSKIELDNIDPILKILMPLLKKKIKDLDSTPKIIRWCVKNNMLQQAITIFTEKMPEYYLRDKNIMQPHDNLFYDAEINKKELTDLYYKLWLDFLTGNYRQDIPFTIENLDTYLKEKKPNYILKIPTEDMKKICRKYLQIKTLRNQINHASLIEAKDETKDETSNISYLRDKHINVDLKMMTVEELKKEVVDAIDFLNNVKVR